MVLAVKSLHTSTFSAHSVYHGADRHCKLSPSHHFGISLGSGLTRLPKRAPTSSLSVNLSQTIQARVGGAKQNAKRSEKLEAEEAEEHLERVDPEFYRMGFMRYVRAYGVEFKEGSKGIGVYAAKDMTTGKTPRVIMEIPLELMITVSKELPWMFFPDIVPLGHPIFEIINSTDPETDWDLRLACLLLLALDQKDNFWHDYSEYLPSGEDITSPLLASEEVLKELQDKDLEQVILGQKRRAVEFWKQHWTGDDIVLKLRRLATDPSQFTWALGVVWSRRFMVTMAIGTRIQDAHMLIPYADMLNHSFQPTCSYRWRKKDRILEVMINPEQNIRQGEEMTLNYGNSASEILMQYYGFSSAKNPFDVVKFSEKAKIHRDSFLSAFKLTGLAGDVSYDGLEEPAVEMMDGAVLAAARSLPTWSDEDLPFLPSLEMKASRALKQECNQFLKTFATTLNEDRFLYESCTDPMLRAAIKYRKDWKTLIRKISEILDLYMQRILF